jgi:hypothetical protein
MTRHDDRDDWHFGATVRVTDVASHLAGLVKAAARCQAICAPPANGRQRKSTARRAPVK